MSTKVKGPMKNPPHPGQGIKREITEELGLSIADAAQHLGVTRPALSRVLNQRASLSWEMAFRLEKAFKFRSDMLMKMQFAHDEAKARKSAKSIRVKAYKAA